jgi:RimJ/RimL family protein N-acetyltransferase
MSDAEVVAWQAWVDEHADDTMWHVDVDGTLAGVAFLHRIREADETATYAIGLFSPEFAGRGLGTDVTRLVLRHAFDRLGLHRVDLRVLEFNTAAIRCYLRCGFVAEGRERDSCRIGDERHADIIMGVLADEFRVADAGLGPV